MSIKTKQTPALGYEYVVCDLCGEDNSTCILEAKDLYNKLPGTFTVVQCQNCGFVYTNPRPHGEELSYYYPDDAGYFSTTQPQERAGPAKEHMIKVGNKLLAAYWNYSHISNIKRVEKLILIPLYLVAKRILEIQGIPRFRQNGKIFDIGCSYGLYLKRMEELGWEVLELEANKKAADFGRKEFGLRIINDTFENADITEKFDVITLRMVLEHLQSPANTLKKVYNLLKENGELIIIVPDFSGIEFRLFKEYCYCLHVPAHLNHFTPSTIRKYCENSGFRIEKIIHHTFDRDFVASAQYMKEDGLNTWRAAILSNKLFRKTILKAVVILLSYFGMTSRMTVWVRKGKAGG